MKPHPPAPPPHAPNLAEQKTDFTAEGAPPPGKVSTDVPATLPPSLPPTRAPAPSRPKPRRR